MWPLFWPGVTFVAVTVSALFFRAALVRALRQWLGPTNALRLLLTAVRFPSMLWCVVGGLLRLDAIGVRITPLLTALGVGGLAVALALQDTLSNLFAGVHLLADRPIRVGDYVKIAETIEGHVVDVGWRSTRVRMLQNNVVIVPNKRVAESMITNYDMPESRLALTIRVAVDYGADPDLVQRI